MMKKNWTVVVGNFFFKYRSYLFVPILVLLVLFTKPQMPFGSTLANGFLNVFGLAVALFGFLIRVVVIGYKKPGTSGRGTSIDVKEVVTDGMYLACRNPLYLANFLIWVGLTIIWWQIYFFVVIVGWFTVEYFFIIKAEESYLSDKFGATYDNYRKSVGAFFPSAGNFKKPDRAFNLKKVLQNEVNLLLLILIFVPLFQIYENKLWSTGSLLKTMVSVFLIFIFLIGWCVNYYYLKKHSAPAH